MPRISPEVRKMIIEKLLTTPKRKGLYKRVDEVIEGLLEGSTETVGPEKAYLFGSFTTKKKVPKDMDILAKYKDVKGAEEILYPEVAIKHGEVHYVPYSLRASKGPNLRSIVEEGKRRSKDWKLIRILSLLGVLGAGASQSKEGTSNE